MSLRKTAAYWEGWLGCQTQRDCRYAEPGKDRDAWARGFADAVSEIKSSKVWWKSKTFLTALVLCAIGLVVWWTGGDNKMLTASEAGQGLGAVGLLFMFLRTISSSPVSWRSSSMYIPTSLK